MSAASVSVVIRCYTEERWGSLVEAVRSAWAQSQKPLEVVVVVDHNPALAARGRAGLPGATIVENHGPRGSAGAWNCGIAAARGAIVAFLDDDAAAAPDWLERLTAEYADDDVAGVGGAIEPVWQSGRPGWFPSEFDWVVGCTYTGMSREAAAVRNLIGCNMSFRRQVFEQLGGFRNGIGHVGGQPFGCDETELCIRLRQQWPRAVLRYTPLARVYHQVPPSRSRWSYFRSRCAMEGRSKAMVARLVGTGDGTATERAYVLRTLPAGVARSLTAALHGDRHGLARACAIAGGLAITALSYAAGRLRGRPLDAPIPAIGPDAAASIRGDTQAMRGDTQAMRGDTQALQVDTQALQVDTQALQVDTQAMRGNTQALQIDSQALQVDTQALQVDTQALQGNMPAGAHARGTLRHAEPRTPLGRTPEGMETQ